MTRRCVSSMTGWYKCYLVLYPNVGKSGVNRNIIYMKSWNVVSRRIGQADKWIIFDNKIY